MIFPSRIKINYNFELFCTKNKEGLLPEIKVVQEPSELIQGSYLMIDQLGRFYDSSTQKHNYSEAILNIGVENALSSIQTNYEKFLLREGNYSVMQESKIIQII